MKHDKEGQRRQAATLQHQAEVRAAKTERRKTQPRRKFLPAFSLKDLKNIFAGGGK